MLVMLVDHCLRSGTSYIFDQSSFCHNFDIYVTVKKAQNFFEDNKAWCGAFFIVVLF